MFNDVSTYGWIPPIYTVELKLKNVIQYITQNKNCIPCDHMATDLLRELLFHFCQL